MKKFLLSVTFLLSTLIMVGQQFEEAKIKSADFEKVTVKLGADFALQYQSIQNVGSPLLTLNKVITNGVVTNPGIIKEPGFMPLGSGVNLPTANMIISSELAPGMRVVLTTYLSSRHHNESWVKDGYFILDAVPFLNSDVVDKIMENLTIKAGVMEVNYGDGHFRRSDNGSILRNPFVENLIMDAFITAPAAEFMVRKSGFIAMVGLNGGTLNPGLVGYNSAQKKFETYDIGDELAFYGKFGYEKQFSDDMKLRLTVSPYYNKQNHRGTLYGSDRAGVRYYSILVPDSIVSGNSPSQTLVINSSGTDIKANHTNGRWGPGSTYSVTSVMVNLFGKFKGLELFGTFENSTGTNVKDGPKFTYNQIAAELLYRFGQNEQYYVGSRYNVVSNKLDESVNRVQVSAGWFLTKNVLMKAEYVNQKYNTSAYTKDAGFKGMMVEAAISF